jgi:hypothetical protein
MTAPVTHRDCAHVKAGSRKPAAVTTVVTMPAWDGDPLHDSDRLCVVCAARLLSLIMRLEQGDETDG